MFVRIPYRLTILRLPEFPLILLSKSCERFRICEMRGALAWPAINALSGFQSAVILQKICDAGGPE